MTPDFQRQLERMHTSAMLWADRAAALTGADARRKNEIAARIEQQVAAHLPHTLEPSRSILLRSAATLFIRAGSPALAVKAAAAGLLGSPPPAIADELMQVIALSGDLAMNDDERG